MFVFSCKYFQIFLFFLGKGQIKLVRDQLSNEVFDIEDVRGPQNDGMINKRVVGRQGLNAAAGGGREGSASEKSESGSSDDDDADGSSDNGSADGANRETKRNQKVIEGKR